MRAQLEIWFRVFWMVSMLQCLPTGYFLSPVTLSLLILTLMARSLCFHQATGCGKTHTITGTPEAPGIVYLLMKDLFDRISAEADDMTVEISSTQSFFTSSSNPIIWHHSAHASLFFLQYLTSKFIMKPFVTF